MEMKWIVFAAILIVNAIAALAMALILMRRPRKPGRNSIIFMLIGLFVWSFGYAMIALTPTLEGKVFWLVIENIGILSVPVHWFFFSLKYARLDGWLTRKPSQLLFWVIPFISFALLASGQWFHLYYSSVQITSIGSGPLVISRGPMYYPAFVQAYALILGGMSALIWQFIRSWHTHRRQLPRLAGAVLVPFIMNLVYQLNPSLLPFFNAPVDLTPLSFTLTAVLLATSIFGLRLFDLIPIARDTVMEHIPEMVFVMDSNDRVMDVNAMAQAFLGKPLDEIIGRDPLEVFRAWPQLLNHFFLTEHTREEIEIPGDPPRTLEVIVTPIYNSQDTLEGRAIVAYDISDRKALEVKLTALNASLQEQLDENERLRLQLQEQAIRDPLTGIFNRRFFAESLEKQHARSKRENVPYSIIILDVDYFKKINDTYGHKCGDIVLQQLSLFLIGNTRQGDIVCRYGGEEFAILMPDASLQDASQRAELLRKRFEAITVEYGEHKIRSTFSAGVVSCPVHADSAETLLIFADLALYHSKVGGRNRVSVYSPDTEYHIPSAQ